MRWNHRWRLGVNLVALPFLLMILPIAVADGSWWAASMAMVGAGLAISDLMAIHAERRMNR